MNAVMLCRAGFVKVDLLVQKFFRILVFDIFVDL